MAESFVNAWNALSLGLCDLLLGWLLHLPSDAALIAVALGTSAAMTAIRLFTTNQERLGRAARDASRVAALAKEAKAANDKAARQRFQTTKTMLAMLKLKAEGWPLLVSILPIALLATWAFHRLEFHPPKAGEPVTLEVNLPESAADQPVTLVPADGLVAADGWIKLAQVTAVAGQPPVAVATWALKAAASDKPYRLVVRLWDRGEDRFRSIERELWVGKTVYAAPIAEHGGEVRSMWHLTQVRLFGVVPGWGAFLPPWLVAYLLLVIPSVFVMKRVFRVY